MADDWEADDWESENFKPVLKGAAAPAAAAAAGPKLAAGEYETAGQALLASVTEPDMSKFQDEEQQEEEEEQSYHIKPQPKKKVEKKWAAKEGALADDDTPLDDPLAEKLRRQRLEEEADMRAGVFGGEGAASASKLAAMIPKTVKDFEEYAELTYKCFCAPHTANKNYKAFLKSLLKHACDALSSEDAKEIENTAGAIRADKVKAEKAAAAAKKTTKKNINVGKAGASAGLDDYMYDAPADDDFDFM